MLTLPRGYNTHTHTQKLTQKERKNCHLYEYKAEIKSNEKEEIWPYHKVVSLTLRIKTLK